MLIFRQVLDALRGKRGITLFTAAKTNEGIWEGSREGLTPDVYIVDWDFGIRMKDMPWFANRGHKQLLAGYYDGDVDYTVTWLKDSMDVKGVEGVMYTTWANHYDDLEKFAQAVWGGGGL